ncbi:hypothetical protein TNCT_149771 [Trichonephila clavata]|uniref:Uncharacterized protein n=1 Tax=Trichonephila clavata TaxID=2740835 RepID=A0A8X6HNB2_TRICU|nr:hypothetical protein TNCT_149771 [Trichonephila clavata]
MPSLNDMMIVYCAFGNSGFHSIISPRRHLLHMIAVVFHIPEESISLFAYYANPPLRLFLMDLEDEMFIRVVSWAYTTGMPYT